MSTLKYYKDNKFNSVNSQVIGDTLPIGSIVPFAGTNVPAGWMLCDGRELLQADYPALFSVIRTEFSEGNDGVHFNLPNLRGRVPVGFDASVFKDNDFGELFGEAEHTLTINEMPSHRHEGAKWFGNTTLSLNGGSDSGLNLTYGSGLSSSSSGIYTEYTGGSQAHNNYQPSIFLNYIIKAFQSAGIVGNVSNTLTDSETDSYSCAYINRTLNTYSTEEQRIGTWIDGKPIYRKVFVIDGVSASENQWFTFSVGFSIGVIINCIGFQSGSNNRYYLDCLPTSSNGIQAMHHRPSTITLNKFIIEYTKTTD